MVPKLKTVIGSLVKLTSPTHIFGSNELEAIGSHTSNKLLTTIEVKLDHKWRLFESDFGISWLFEPDWLRVFPTNHSCWSCLLKKLQGLSFLLKILEFYFGIANEILQMEWTMYRGWQLKKGYLMENLDLQCYGLRFPYHRRWKWVPNAITVVDLIFFWHIAIPILVCHEFHIQWTQLINSRTMYIKGPFVSFVWTHKNNNTSNFLKY